MVTDTRRSRASAHGGPRVVFLGMRGEFSRLPLTALLDAGVDVRAVLVPGEGDDTAPTDAPALQRLIYQPPPRSTLPLLTRTHEPSIITLAWEHGIPVLAPRRGRNAAVAPALAAYQADGLCVACWPRRLPASLLALPRLGCLNLHPSLLPAHRGPAPLFWTLRHGDAQAGVTVHLMDATLDGGDILTQADIALADGMTGAELERRCAEVGGHLMAETLAALAAGTAQRMPQPAGAGSYEPWPKFKDLVVRGNRSARWAFNFIRGAAHWAGPMLIAVAGNRFGVRAALDYTSDGRVPGGWRLEGDELWLGCAPGVLHVTVD